MKIVISIDSFKDSISSFEAGHALQEAIKQQFPDDIVKVFPLADGGEGTVTAMTQGLGGKIVPVEVMGPLGEAVSSRYGYLPDNEMAIIEMADSSGLPMVPVNRRNPMDTTTYGLGQLIAKAMDNGCKRFIIGIGGSATNDCGLGMLTALGYDFYKADGTKAGIFGKDLADIASIDTSHVNSKLKNCVFQIACDVNNPLCGLNGCSYIYGPQKGATPQIVTTMDEYISDFAQVAEKAMGRKGRDMAGAGAAGGLGFAFHVFINGNLTPGVELILGTIGMEKELIDADVLITGEGRMDKQTAMGKAPAGVAQLAKKCNPDCVTVALCGCATDEAFFVNEHGIDGYFPILQEPMTAQQAMDKDKSKENLGLTVRQVMNLIHRMK